MDSKHIRQQFLQFFEQHGHEIVPSSALVPANDPTLLFTNAGMVQFKDVFLGQEQRPYQRATSSQRCVRAGGKHNDLENVGHTKRHHTFFEMLGNFSFGDYFKQEAIQYAWQFLTEVMKMPAERLWISVYKDDQESEEIWLKHIKIDPKRLSRCGKADNFWSMGEVGPCGPCTEIFYDHGPSLAGGPPGSKDQDGDRYVEIWNLVFMQYERNSEGQLNPLPKPCVDTGMGLERIAAVKQGVHDNYDTDLFVELLTALAKIVNCNDFQSPSMRVIVDHIRSVAFLIADGVLPSNEGRGYVLRRIIRRAVRHGYKLGQQQAFFYRLTDPLVAQMGDAYPELARAATTIKQMIKQEEIQFSSTLENGLKMFDQVVSDLKTKQIPGQVAFQLYDTYGFPVDLTADLARERNLTIDYVGFNEAMTVQRQQSQQAHQFKAKQVANINVADKTEFTGYEHLSADAKVIALLHDDQAVDELVGDQRGIVILDRTPFYAESGGQVGDRGVINFNGGQFKVKDTQKQGQAYLHYGQMKRGHLRSGDTVQAEVDQSRQDIVLNHSATHLLHEALRRVLGEHVVQKGSLVAADRLRFDFAHASPLTPQEVTQVETMVNQQIRANLPSHLEETTIDEAKAHGALALFGEKYAEKVRVLSMGDFSTEVCGGTHTKATGEIGLFKITTETACAAGVRRIEAVTGQYALVWVQANDYKLQTMAAALKTNADDAVQKLNQTLQEQRDLQKQLEQLKQRLAQQQTQMIAEQAVAINDIKVVAMELAADRETLRHSVDQLKQQLGKAAIVLATVVNHKVQLVVGVSKSCLGCFTAPQLLKHVAGQIDGRGGGRDDLAQGGGERPEALTAALDSVVDWVEAQCSKTAAS